MRKNPWTVLGITPTNNLKSISDAWRRLAQKSHPDKGGDAETFLKIKEAYEQALVLAPTIILIRKPQKHLSFELTLLASEVLNSQTKEVQFYDHLGRIVKCDVIVPAWKLAWGSTQTLRIIDVEASDHMLVTLDIICNIQSDTLTITNEGLILTPEILAASAVNQPTVSFDWNGANTINIDKHGQGMLYSIGYLLADGARSNILVKPKYVFN